MIIADDFRTDTFAAYGRNLSVTPALDALVADPRTMFFEKSYANYAQCAPSRLSFLSGLSPDTTGPINASIWAATKPPTQLSIPEFFRAKGFNVLTGGKVFHEDVGPSPVDLLWNSTYQPFQNQYTFGRACKYGKAKHVKMANGAPAAPGMVCDTSGGPGTLIDFVLAEKASYALTKLAMSPEIPFFLAVGFYKPHMPWVVHEDFWNIIPDDAPDESTAGPQPMASYLPIFYDVDASLSSIGGNSWPWGASHIQSNFVQVVRRAYSAAVTQTDSLIQVLMDRLDQLHLANTTLVMVFGDHGFNLGENGLWNKDTVFDTALRVPMIIRVPWSRVPLNPLPLRRATSYFIELLDLYRTLAGLMGYDASEVGSNIQGRDFSAYILKEIESNVSSNAAAATEVFGQVRRCGYTLDNVMVSQECEKENSGTSRPIVWMGYSVRNDSWRYTVWLNAPNGVVNWQIILGEELYDHRNDEDSLYAYVIGASYNEENLNVANENQNVTKMMFAKVMQRFQVTYS